MRSVENYPKNHTTHEICTVFCMIAISDFLHFIFSSLERHKLRNPAYSFTISHFSDKILRKDNTCYCQTPFFSDPLMFIVCDTEISLIWKKPKRGITFFKRAVMQMIDNPAARC